MSAIGNYYSQKNGYSGKYEMIISQDDLTRALNDSFDRINYPLLKESKRSRFLIANGKYLKEVFVQEVMKDIQEEFAKMQVEAAGNIAQMVISAVNGAALSAKNTKFTLNFGAILGKAAVKAIETVSK